MKRFLYLFIIVATAIFSCDVQESEVINANEGYINYQSKSAVPATSRVEVVGGCDCIGDCTGRELRRLQYPNHEYYQENVILENRYYSFRDDFLSKSNLGRQYIAVYYDSGDNFMAILDMEIIGRTLDVLPSINVAITNLLDTSYNGKIVDTNLANKINDFIAVSIDKTESISYKNSLIQLHKDFNNIVNISKTDVYRYFDVK
tara:strand:+ start:2437 stop:3045 length:609 start_codon:yes stop_codon:yes gene_type:complete